MVYIKCDRCGESSIKGTDEVYCTECYLKLRDEVIVLTAKIKELEKRDIIEINSETKKYTISVYGQETFWISRQDNERAGEGMEVSEEKLFEVINKFYEKNI